MTAVIGSVPAPPDRETSAPTGYTVVLPPGWSRIPLRRGAEQAITNILDRSFAGLPRDQVATLRQELRLRLRELAGRARENCGLDLYVPTERMRGVTVAASFVVAEMSLGSVQPVDPARLVAQIVAQLAADDAHTTAVDVAGTVATRAEHLAAEDAERGIEHESRRVDYVLGVPDDPDRWVVVSFSTLGSGDLAQLLVELFDAVMTTFRWRRQ
ncbi:MAG: hypothetical protein ACRDRW_11490 [Pseudonocardiaceae bacterium]